MTMRLQSSKRVELYINFINKNNNFCTNSILPEKFIYFSLSNKIFLFYLYASLVEA